MPSSARSSHSVHSAGATSFVWDNAASPVLEVDSGEVIDLEAADASGGQLTETSTAADVASLDLGRVNPITGPVFVRGAQPGDVLAVEILELRPHGWVVALFWPTPSSARSRGDRAEASVGWYRINRELRDYGRSRGYDLGQNPTASLLALFPGAIIIVP